MPRVEEMAEISDAPAVTSGELAAVLRAMDEKYRALFDAISKQASSSKSEAEIKEEIHPLQMPHVKLEGPENYVSWAEHAETILVSRKLEGYILGTVEKPEEEGSKEGQKWRATNALVRAWLLSSMSSQIAKQVERIKDASEIWRLLKGTYSGVGNEMLACKIQKELQELSQGERTVVEYVSELKRLWSDLDYYDPVEMECGKCIEKHSKWTERRRVRDFLNGLHPRFENRRAALYGSGKLPSLEQAISAIASEETRLRLEAAGSASQGVTQRRSAFLAAGGGRYQRTGAGNGERKCFECGSPGHLVAGCPKLMGGGRGRGQDWRGRARGRLFDACGGRGRGMLFPGRANTSVAEEVSQKLSVEITPDELEKWRQFKNLNLGVEQPQESHASSSSSANFSGNNSHTVMCTDYLAAGAQWLIDSGASRHMTGSIRELSNYIPVFKKENVKLADGSTQAIVGSGIVKCSPNMSLSSVLHVPAFPINLLSISCITRELNCAAIFFPTWCIFQELGTGKEIGIGSIVMGYITWIVIYFLQWLLQCLPRH